MVGKPEYSHIAGKTRASGGHSIAGTYKVGKRKLPSACAMKRDQILSASGSWIDCPVAEDSPRLWTTRLWDYQIHSGDHYQRTEYDLLVPRPNALLN
jgi:hypothetical protein